MSAEVKNKTELEIAHVLFIDTVGYSKLLIDEQRDLLDTLNRIVRNTECFRSAEGVGKLIRLPTGDGMALVFLDDPEAPIRCALEVSRSAREQGNIPLRMGIHSGPVSRVVDVNDHVNVAGAGINTAQRVMNCGDTGHVLLSKRAAADLAEYRHWQPYLHDLGEVEVKHGAKLGLVNLCNEEIGNPKLPSRLKQVLDEQTAQLAEHRAAFRRKLFMIASVAVALIAIGLAIYGRFHRNKINTELLKAAHKSIAVLPFANLTDDKQNAYLAEGIADEIMTDLAKVEDLKVISRTSVMQYRPDRARNLREIAKELGVTHVLEGTVQRDGGRVRVSAQLIDAMTDTHMWAQSYNRDLADIFALESELAKTIVTQLKSRLSPEEKEAIETQPTVDLDAHQLYVQAKNVLAASVYTRGKENRLEAVRLLESAIARDHDFFLAHCLLVRIHSELYLLAFDHTPARLALADEALKVVTRLRPDAGETHLASAFRLYSTLEYDRARHELVLADRTLRNEPLVFELAGYIDRRQGRWDDAARELASALELDPRNFYFLQQISQTYEKLRRFDEMAKVMKLALAVVPEDPGAQIHLASADFFGRANTKPLRATLETILRNDPAMAPSIAVDLIHLSLCERNYAAAERALATMPERGGTEESFAFPRDWYAGLIARAKGDPVAARNAFNGARATLQEVIRAQPGYAQPRAILAMVDAALGNKDEAIAEGRRAVELLPIDKDSINGALSIEYLAIACAWSGDKDHAIEQLSIVSRKPSDVNYGLLRLHPFWDPLRGDSRFEKIVADMGPVAER